MRAGLAQAFLAEYAGTPLAHVILLHFGPKCWYFYGASSTEERQRMPNYALQWHAIQWAQAQGYATYDFWGAPDSLRRGGPHVGRLPVQARLRRDRSCATSARGITSHTPRSIGPTKASCRVFMRRLRPRSMEVGPNWGLSLLPGNEGM